MELRFGLLTSGAGALAQAHSGATAVLVNELDASDSEDLTISV